MANNSNVAIYTGVTNNLQRRVYQHKNNLSPDSFTARYKIHKLVYYETTNDIYSAISREKQIKGHSRKWKNELINSFNPVYFIFFSYSQKNKARLYIGDGITAVPPQLHNVPLIDI